MKKNKKLLFSGYFGGTLKQREKRLIKSFFGVQHKLHNRHILGKEYEYVTKKMDSQIGGGRKHRLYGHNEGFIQDNFKKEKEKLAASLHLLGDFISDLLIDVFKYVLDDIKTGKIKPPYYVFYRNESSWDLKSHIKDDMAKKWADIFINSLKKKNRR